VLARNKKQLIVMQKEQQKISAALLIEVFT